MLIYRGGGDFLLEFFFNFASNIYRNIDHKYSILKVL